MAVFHVPSLFESRVEEVVRSGLHRVLEAGRLRWLEQVKKNWDFYNGNQIHYLKPYPGEKEDEFKSKKKCPFNYTAAVVDEYMAGVYQLPVTRTFKSETNNAVMKRIADGFQFDPFFRKVQKIAELSSMCGVVIRTDENKKRIFLEEIPGEFVKIYTNKKYPDGIENVIIAYNFDNDDPNEGIIFRVEGWSREKAVIYEVHGKEIRKVYAEENNLKDEHGEPFIPIVFFRPDEDAYSPYGQSNIDVVVELNHAYNGMWMDIMRTVQLQQFSILFLRRPGDEQNEAPEPLEMAPTRMIEDSSPDADAKYVTPDPKIQESLEALEKLKREMLDLSKVPVDVLGSGNKSGVESAAALRIKRIPIERVWKQRKASYGSSEVELCRKLILMAKAVWNEGDLNDLNPTIDYSEAMQPVDVKEKMEQDVFELQWGLTNPYQLYLEKDPDVGGIEEAGKVVQKNLEITKAVMVETQPTIAKETLSDFHARIQKFRQAAHRVNSELKGNV